MKETSLIDINIFVRRVFNEIANAKVHFLSKPISVFKVKSSYLLALFCEYTKPRDHDLLTKGLLIVKGNHPLSFQRKTGELFVLTRLAKGGKKTCVRLVLILLLIG